MRRLSWSLLIASLAFLAAANQLFAQAADTLVISPLPPGNINTVINGDTLAGGVRAHPNRVYVLRHGVVYQVGEAMKINGSITIVANDSTAGLRPPVLAPQILQDGSSIDHFFDLNGKGGKVTIKNVYITAFRADSIVIGWGEGIRMNSDSLKLTLTSVVFDGFQHTALAEHGQWDKLIVQDCTFRNEIHPSSYFGGGALLSDYQVNMDTTMFVNNTFFCNNAYLWSVRGYCPNAVFSHNTVVYGAVNPTLMRQGQIMRMDNNVWYGMNAYGGVPEDVINGTFLNYPDTASSSIIRFRGNDSTSAWSKMWGATITGPEVFIGTGGTGNATVTSAMVAPASRFISVRNNDYFQPAALVDFWTAYNDTVTQKDSVDMPDGSRPLMLRKLAPPTWMSGYTKFSIKKLDSLGAHIDTSGNVYVDPGFNSNITAQVSKLISYVNKIASWMGVKGPDSSWYYTYSGFPYPPVWPLPENLAYTNTSMQHGGTDGYALGDLNWFPTQKAAWLASGGLALGVQKVPNQLPDKFELGNNYPNPFNPSTDVRVSLKSAGIISFNVYNVLGQLVKVVDEGYKPAGVYIYNITMDNFASGVYFYSLRQGGNTITKKMLLLK